MDLYFAQHGQAKSKDEDPDRPLTSSGRDETRRVARSAARAGVTIDAVWHSGKTRARQTAEIFAEALAPEGAVQRQDWLGPLDDPRKAVEAAEEDGESVLLVGHKPYLSRLPSLLLAGNPEAEVVDVRYSGLAALRRNDEGWSLRWYLRPEVIA